MKENRLADLLSPVLEQFGLELDDLDVQPAGKRRLLRVTVDGDGPQGRGPSLDDIAEATRAISNSLDESNAMGDQPYTLEVSSRGTSRPLTAPRHWRRNTGRLVAVTPHEGAPVTGRILSSDDSGARLEVVTDPKKNLVSEREIAYADIARAVIQVELTKSSGEADEDD